METQQPIKRPKRQSKPAKKQSVIKIGATAVAVIIIGMVAATYIINNIQKINPPVFANTNQPLPDQFVALKTLSSDKATNIVMSMIQGQIADNTQVNVTYKGQIQAHLAGIGSIVGTTTPIVVSYMRSGNDLAFSVNATSLPIIGSVIVQEYNTTNGSTQCSNLNLTAISDDNLENARNPNGLSCQSVSPYAVSAQNIRYLNITQLSAQHGIAINYTNEYQSQYKGQNCTYVTGTLLQSSKNGHGTFSMCISDQDSMPLSSYLSFTNQQATIYMILNQS